MIHYYKRIPGFFDFEDVYTRAVQEARDGAHFVEIGCYKGASSAFMGVEIINSGKLIRLDCIDSWEFTDDDYNTPCYADKDTAFNEFRRNTHCLRKVLRYYQLTSEQASEMYADNSLDFVYIDASHIYYFVLQDIKKWYPKVKHGGVIAGHDITFDGVNRAVRYFFDEEYMIMHNSWIHRKE